MEIVEIFSALGTPARLSARILFFPQYCLDNFISLRHWPRNKYARQRFGLSFRFRLWLLFDCKELEELEDLINNGSDEMILKLRETRLESFRLVALVGALLASVALQGFNIPLISSASFIVRGQFLISFMLSILATFFTCVQQRAFGGIRTAAEVREWLSSGVRYENADGLLVYQSSAAALNLLDMPYELLAISVTSLLGGMAAYLGSAYVHEVRLNAGSSKGEVAVIVVFAVGTGFAFLLFPVLLGSKVRESKAVRKSMMGFEER